MRLDRRAFPSDIPSVSGDNNDAKTNFSLRVLWTSFADLSVCLYFFLSLEQGINVTDVTSTGRVAVYAAFAGDNALE